MDWTPPTKRTELGESYSCTDKTEMDSTPPNKKAKLSESFNDPESSRTRPLNWQTSPIYSHKIENPFCWVPKDKPMFESLVNRQQSESTDNHQESPVTQSKKWKEGKSKFKNFLIWRDIRSKKRRGIRSKKRKKFTTAVALIFYTKEGREDGAMEEATLLETSLKNVIGHVIRQEWSIVTELEDSLQTNITGLSAKCPLLFISVMSHGRMGALCGSDGLLLPVNDLIDQVSRVIPANLPLVLLIQACQGIDVDLNSGGDTDAASLSTDAKRAAAEGCMHIDLVRPNTVLLMATATGGSALRGAYIKALAAEISKADGKKDIHEMHLSAVQEMMNNNYAYLDDIKQVPKYTDTMKERLVLSFLTD